MNVPTVLAWMALVTYAVCVLWFRRSAVKAAQPHRFASLIIRDGLGRFLALNHFKRTAKPWGFAGGKISPNELPIAAAARELWEELGVVATALTLFTTTTAVINGVTWSGHWFVVDNYSGDLKLQEPGKHSEVLWLNADELRQFGAVPEHELAQILESL